MRPLKNAKFCFSGKEGENFNHRNTPPVFRGLKFEPDRDSWAKGGVLQRSHL
jgi:hypothetical protein